jgi:heme exporter protein C
MSDTTISQGWFTSLANPTRFLALSGEILPYLATAAVLSLVIGLYMSFAAPEDYQQGDHRADHVHPCAGGLACHDVLHR